MKIAALRSTNSLILTSILNLGKQTESCLKCAHRECFVFEDDFVLKCEMFLARARKRILNAFANATLTTSLTA